jgi:hypothetical protein
MMNVVREHTPHCTASRQPIHIVFGIFKVLLVRKAQRGEQEGKEKRRRKREKKKKGKGKERRISLSLMYFSH